MKKLPLLMAMLALVLVTAVPAMGVEDVSAVEDVCVADNELAEAFQAGLGNIDDSCTDTTTTDQEFEQDHFESGDIEETDEVDIAGNDNDVCAPSQSTNNTGNTGNEQGIAAPSDFDDAELNGDTSEFAPEQTTDCAAS